MNFEKGKHSKILKGKSFYIVIALCIMGIGAATWMSLAGGTDEPPEEMPPESVVSEPEGVIDPEEKEPLTVPSDTVDTDKKDEPYTPPEEEEPTPQKPVANTLVLPLNGNIQKEFSDDTLIYSTTYRDMRVHHGIDIAGKSGDSVRAAGNGTVTSVVDDSLLGLYIEVDHGKGLVARYCGFSSVLVEEGDTVDALTELGRLGEVPEECLDAAHLHLEFTRDSVPVDPLEIIYPQG